MNHTEYFYDETYFEKSFAVQHRVDKPLSFEAFSNSLVLPYKKVNTEAGEKIGGGIVAWGGYIDSSSVHTGFGCAYDVSEKEVQFCDETAIYIGVFPTCWGHCITDSIRRLWFLKTEHYKDKYQGCKIIYVPADDFTFGASFRSFLEILGFNPDNFTPITKPTRFREIVLPDESFYTLNGNERYFTAEYADMIHDVREYGLKNFKKLDFDKVYFTYAHYKLNRSIGEYRLEQFFKKQGYKIIAPERFSFPEQLNILLNCKSFASTVGSCSHNIMFMNEGSQVILIPRAKYLTGYQVAVNEVTELDIHWISSDLSVMANSESPWFGPFYYHVSKQLREFFCCDDDGFSFGRNDLHNFKLYLQLGAIRAKDLAAHNFPAYYQKVLMNCLEEYRNRSRLCQFKKKIKWVQVRARLEQKLHEQFNRI